MVAERARPRASSPALDFTTTVLQIEDDPTGGKYAAVSSILNGAPHKLENIIQFHVGDMVTSLQRAVMQPGGQESIIYGTVMGGIGEPLPGL